MCKFCMNARVNHELNDNNDLSYHTMGDSLRGFRCMIRSGNGRPIAILFDELIHNNGWRESAIYYPKFCPECGRPLKSDYPEWRKLYDKK